jgi:GAF domain-containing protein
MTFDIRELGYEPTDLRVTISELMVATAEQTDDGLDRTISEVLKLLRERMHMDVVFCSEFVDGQRVIRQAATPANGSAVVVGQSDSLEASWCQRVVEGRLPRFIPNTQTEPSTRALVERAAHPVGTHISAPIVLKNGQVYGTLCSYTFSPQDNPKPDDLKTLEMTARLIAMRLDGQQVMPPPKEIPNWELQPK